MRIIQVSDLHIGADALPVNEVDVRGHFRQVIDALASQDFDVLVLSGDLAAQNGEPEAYLWIREQLSAISAPVLFMAGNHDNTAAMSRIFGLENRMHNGFLTYSETIRGVPIFFLDSSKNRIDDIQLSLLEEKSASFPSGETLLFIHHPPVDCGCLFMDTKYPLKDRASVWARISALQGIRHIFCGHYHTEKTVAQDGRVIYLTPSTMVQITQDSPVHQIEHSRPGYRSIEWDGKSLKTRVQYL